MFLCKLPMKNGIPCLEYDMAAAAQFLLPEVPNVVPAYLSGYFKNLRALADKSEALRPKKFPTGNRVYILDCRFNLLFAGIDQAPSWSVEMYDYAHEHRSQTRYHYGNGVSFESDSATMDAFVRQFGFLPNFAVQLQRLLYRISAIFAGVVLYWGFITQRSSVYCEHPPRYHLG